MLKDKEQQLELARARAATAPSVVQQQQFQDQLEELLRERERLLGQFRDQRDRLEHDRMEELEQHRQEIGELRRALDSLQKEISDRQVGVVLCLFAIDFLKVFLGYCIDVYMCM